RDGDAIEQAVKMIEAGFVLGMFPEGTRSRDGALQRGRTGVARIALQANALVVPVVVINSEPVLRDVLKLRRRPLVTIRFGQPIRPAAALVGADAAPDAVQQFTTEIMLALAALLPPARHGYYSDPVADYGAASGEPLLPADSA
ncbi:MAG: 1-acyl-sn-glycerol-3-phosphate acyltransferase, partial [Caldilineaceae bacterium]|nr:1-acyl-sn-glycerol-3-phosphate acyltransferase [Caldilineaceae bacterium]